jgi:phosphate transport system permease protein
MVDLINNAVFKNQDLALGNSPKAKSDLPFRLLVRGVAIAFGVVIILFLWSIVHQSLPTWSSQGLGFLTNTSWSPSTNQFGAAPLILGTLITASIALVIAVPVGLGTALVITFLLPRRVRTVMTSLVELLAAIPSVVYGLWGLIVLVPIFANTIEPKLQSWTGGIGIFSGATQGLGLLLAGLVLAVMVLPTIVAISRDVLAAVPSELIEGGFSLGATRSQVLVKVVLPTAKTGILGAVSLGAGRALGETIAVAMVIGSSPQMPHSLFSVGATLASIIATQFVDASAPQLAALGACALVLMVFTASVNAVARSLVRKTTKLAA